MRAAITRVFIGVAIAVVSVGSGVRLLAHHSFSAEFDGNKPIRLIGNLSKIEWQNPHSYFYIDVKDDKGAVVNWGCEAGAPGALSRRGWKRGDIKLGDLLVVDGYLAKDGSHLVDARRVTLPDGRIVSGASAGDGGPGSERQDP
jgi:Family of unknown function (DUF6152)